MISGSGQQPVTVSIPLQVHDSVLVSMAAQKDNATYLLSKLASNSTQFPKIKIHYQLNQRLTN